MIVIPVSLGELVDKITILQIKKSMIKDEDQLSWVVDELASLVMIKDLYLKDTGIEIPELLWQKLFSLNLTLWQVEDDLRKFEQDQSFGDEFVAAARSVYFTNDLRYDVKYEITELDENATVKEQKSYA